MEARLCMTHALYWYEEFKPNNDEDDHHVDIVKEDELVKLLSQFIGSLVLEFKDVSGYTQIICNDYALSHRDLVLSSDEFEVKQKLKVKYKYITTIN